LAAKLRDVHRKHVRDKRRRASKSDLLQKQEAIAAKVRMLRLAGGLLAGYGWWPVVVGCWLVGCGRHGWLAGWLVCARAPSSRARCNNNTGTQVLLCSNSGGHSETDSRPLLLSLCLWVAGE
jgi:hypothetical protein